MAAMTEKCLQQNADSFSGGDLKTNKKTLTLESLLHGDDDLLLFFFFDLFPIFTQML